MNALPHPHFKVFYVISPIPFQPSVIQGSRECKFLPSSRESNPRLWVEALCDRPVPSSET